MKKWTIIVLSVIVISCGGTNKEIKPVVFDNYKGYFLKNDVVPENEMFYYASTKYDNFEDYFGVAATMSKQKWIEELNLANQMIIGIGDKTGNDTESIKIDSILQQGNAVYVDYSIIKRNEPASYTSRPIAVAVAAARNIKTVIFRESGEEVKQIDLK